MDSDVETTQQDSSALANLEFRAEHLLDVGARSTGKSVELISYCSCYGAHPSDGGVVALKKKGMRS